MAAGKFNTSPNYDDDIEFIEDSDPVQGDPPGTDPAITPLTGTANKIFQKIISSLAYLKNAVDNFSIERMTDTVLGIGRTATQQEAEDGTAHGVGGPVLTPLRGRQMARAYIRTTDAQATTTQRGTARRATQTQAEGLTNDDAYLTAVLVKAILEHANAEATTSKRGTVEFATETEAQDESNNTKALTAASLYRKVNEDISTKYEVTESEYIITGISFIDSNINRLYFGPISLNEYEGNITIELSSNQNIAGSASSLSFNISPINESIPQLPLESFSWTASIIERPAGPTNWAITNVTTSGNTVNINLNPSISFSGVVRFKIRVTGTIT